MNTPQPAILASLPGHCRYMEFALAPGADPAPALKALAARPHANGVVIGLGPAVVLRLGARIEGLRPLPALGGPGCAVPSTQAGLWCWAGGGDRGDVLHLARASAALLAPAFLPERVVDGFKYGGGLDLTGYEDGTENPEGEDALAAAIAADGSSMAAVQQWVHDLDGFAALPPAERDHIIGRRLGDNEELDDAPASAHVKRTAQESFTPEAFVLRRSMPWADAGGEGLMFVAFGKSADAFEAQMRRMVGEEDGVVDGLFRFSRPVTGGYFWCPPLKNGRLDLSALDQ